MIRLLIFVFFFFSSRRRHTRLQDDWSSDVCSPDLEERSRPRFVFISTLEGTKRMRGLFERLSARACRASDRASFRENKSNGEGPHGRSTRSATSAAW